MKYTPAVVTLLVLVSLVPLGCASRPAIAPADTVTPYQVHQDPLGALTQCHRAVQVLAKMPVGQRYELMVLGCANVIVGDACREAWVSSVRMDPTLRVTAIARVCAADYCDTLPEPRSRMCEGDWEDVEGAEQSAALTGFFTQVFAEDLGMGHSSVLAGVFSKVLLGETAFELAQLSSSRLVPKTHP